jgi:hypothetical protein
MRDEQRAFIVSEEIASILLFMWRENSAPKCRTKRATAPLASELLLFQVTQENTQEVRHGTSDRVPHSGAISQTSEVGLAAPEG